MKKRKTYIDKNGLPTRAGIYLILIPKEIEPCEIDVYRHHVKGLCCFIHDYGGDIINDGVDDRYDCHVSVQFTGLTFIKRLRNFSKNGVRQEAEVGVIPEYTIEC